MASVPRYSRREIGPLMALGGTMALSAAAAAKAVQPNASGQVRPSRPPLEDRFGILDLFAEYCWSFDCQDAAFFASLFTEDGEFQTVGSGARGRANIAVYIPTLWAQHRDEIWQHHADQLLFFGKGNSYTVYSYWSVLKTKEQNASVMGFGYYVSRCVKQNGNWLFQSRHLYRGAPQRLPWVPSP